LESWTSLKELNRWADVLIDDKLWPSSSLGTQLGKIRSGLLSSAYTGPLSADKAETGNSAANAAVGSLSLIDMILHDLNAT
jgi:hypothetical protein